MPRLANKLVELDTLLKVIQSLQVTVAITKSDTINGVSVKHEIV